ncbi:hypothetical protein NECAME_07407 [Necator americanus]|uniref:EF-hand domain-containing protein n=1 Tax=Necator americanus TaxID=51031 RepID=W2TNP9_NECAM|nr:hypothetical protein NECAME_07407 [Necator americanus]ETN83398.1 hypothetical protein NECAME_07407 [Necator americanus]
MHTYFSVQQVALRSVSSCLRSRPDRNASHQVDWGDFYLVVRKVRDIYGAESVQTAYAKKTLAALWEGLCKLADADEDQLISIDEWINLLRKAEHTKERKWFDEYERFMFKLFDVSCELLCMCHGKIDKHRITPHLLGGKLSTVLGCLACASPFYGITE